MMLTGHFFECDSWVTLNSALRDRNRTYALQKGVREVVYKHAIALEKFRECVGNRPVRIHSWVRCPELNGETPGHSSTSEHPKGNASDVDVLDQTPELTFQLILEAARAGKIAFNQLIIERVKDRFPGIVDEWVHFSSPDKILPPEKRGLAMRMVEGADGQQHYEVVQKFEFKEA
jgi:hypothetical protein